MHLLIKRNRRRQLLNAVVECLWEFLAIGMILAMIALFMLAVADLT